MKVRNVLEAQLPRPYSRTTEPSVPSTDRITIRTDARHFESFLRSIGRCSSLLDARRLKNDIMGEIRRTRALLGEWLQTLKSVVSILPSEPRERGLDQWRKDGGRGSIP